MNSKSDTYTVSIYKHLVYWLHEVAQGHHDTPAAEAKESPSAIK